MDFNFSDEQTQLQELLSRFIAKDYDFERYRALKKSPEGFSRDTWNSLAELGVMAVGVPEEQGGLGYGPLETLVLMDAVGKGLLLEPVLSSAVIATALLREIEAPAAKTLLEQLASGETIATLAHGEPGSRYDTAAVEARAQPSGEGWSLSGHKAVVAHAPLADLLLVTARTDDGVGVFAVPRETPGVQVQGYPTIDGQRAGEVVLRDVKLASDACLATNALPQVELALDIGLAAVCAEAVGIMQALVDATSEYLRTRKQFGQPIGRFQALQHRVADMLLWLEQSRSMSYLAAMRCSEADADARRKVLSAAKVTIGHGCRFIGQQAVQLHGGMGMTDELQVSHWFKRLTAIELTLGDTDTHLQRFAALTRG